MTFASLIAHLVKNPPVMQETWVRGKVPWRRERLCTPKFWPGVSRYCIVHGLQRLGRDGATFTFFLFPMTNCAEHFLTFFFIIQVSFSMYLFRFFCTFLEFEFRPFNELKEVGKMKYNKSRKEVIVIDPLQRQKGLPSKICLEC